MRYLHSGGADSPAGLYLYDANGAALANGTRPDDTHDMADIDASIANHAEGQPVYLYVSKLVTGDWSNLFVDNIRFADSAGNVLQCVAPPSPPSPPPLPAIPCWAVSFTFEDQTVGSCPVGWTCSGGAHVDNTGVSGKEGSNLLLAGSDNDQATARSALFALPPNAATMRYLHSGGADSPAGLYLYDANGAALANGTRPDDTLDMVDVDASIANHAEGQPVYLIASKLVTGGWSNLFVDNIRFADSAGNVLQCVAPPPSIPPPLSPPPPAPPPWAPGCDAFTGPLTDTELTNNDGGGSLDGTSSVAVGDGGTVTNCCATCIAVTNCGGFTVYWGTCYLKSGSATYPPGSSSSSGRVGYQLYTSSDG